MKKFFSYDQFGCYHLQIHIMSENKATKKNNFKTSYKKFAFTNLPQVKSITIKGHSSLLGNLSILMDSFVLY